MDVKDANAVSGLVVPSVMSSVVSASVLQMLLVWSVTAVHPDTGITPLKDADVRHYLFGLLQIPIS